jgi:hypothetical protein
MSAGGVEVTQRARDAADAWFSEWHNCQGDRIALVQAFARFEAETPLPPAVVDALREGLALIQNEGCAHSNAIATRLTALLDGTDAGEGQG